MSVLSHCAMTLRGSEVLVLQTLLISGPGEGMGELWDTVPLALEPGMEGSLYASLMLKWQPF